MVGTKTNVKCKLRIEFISHKSGFLSTQNKKQNKRIVRYRVAFNIYFVSVSTPSEVKVKVKVKVRAEFTVVNITVVITVDRCVCFHAFHRRLSLVSKRTTDVL